MASRTDFQHAVMEQPAIFNDAQIALANFEHCHFQKSAYFRRTKFGAVRFDSCLADDQLEFEQTELTRAEFSGAPLEKFRFIHCIWPRHQGRDVIYEARQIETSQGKQGFVKLDQPPTVDTPKIWGGWPGFLFLDDQPILGAFETPPDTSKLADTFRRLKKIADLEKDQPLVSDWHFWEKEMQRLGRKQDAADFRPKLKTWWANLGIFILLQAYKSACGYGENPARAAIVLSLLILLPFVGLAILNAPAHPDFYIPLLASKSPEGLILGFKVLHKAYQLIITVQAGFFGLAMRNRYRR